MYEKYRGISKHLSWKMLTKVINFDSEIKSGCGGVVIELNMPDFTLARQN